MKIGVMSDSHDHLPNLRKAVACFNGRDDIDRVIHAGDFVAPFAMSEVLKLRAPVLAVVGNNDGEVVGLRKLLPELARPPRTWKLAGRRVCVTHDLDKLADPGKADVIVYGHTHRAEIDPGPPLKVNPGEVCGYLTNRPTVAVIGLDSLSVEIIDLP